MKFEYPVPVNNPEYSFGQTNSVGTYPIGRLFNWHGGLHVAERSNGPVKAIADGVIIAYRIAKSYLGDDLKYSNSFILIKHKYISPKGNELTFYSLYNHLMCFDELKSMKKIPDIFSKTKFKVKGIVTHDEKGLNLRGTNYNTKFIIPCNSIVETDSSGNQNPSWAKGKSATYKKVKYKHPDTDFVFENYYMAVDSQYAKALGNGQYKVIAKGNGAGFVGENLRKESNSKSGIITNVPNNSVVLGQELDGNYNKIEKINDKILEGYIWKESLKKIGKALDFDENNLDKVITGEDCEKIVKAGEIVGFSGACGFDKDINYRASHVEVFTKDDPSQFLKGVGVANSDDNDKDDVKNTKNFLKFKKGAKLTLKYPVTFLKGDTIKVLDFPSGEDEKYCRIKLHSQTRTVIKKWLHYVADSEEKDSNNNVTAAKYTPEKLTELNDTFNYTITKDTTFDWVAHMPDKDGEEQRKVCNTLAAGEFVFWVEKSKLGISEAPEKPIVLNSDLTTLFYKKPDTNIEVSLGEDYIRKPSKLEILKIEGVKEKWYKLKLFSPKKHEHGYICYEEIEGLISPTKENSEFVSAYDWEAFGFKIYKDQPNMFVFDKTIEPLTAKNAPEFLKTTWNLIDEDGDGNLTRSELRNALGNQFSQRKFSRMICYHQSEWGNDYASIKPEVETLLDEGIEKETVDEKKQKLKENKTIVLDRLEKKLADFDFWGKVQEPEITISDKGDFKNYTPTSFKLKLKGKKIIKPLPFVFPLYKGPIFKELDLPEIPKIDISFNTIPAKPELYHFHPIAFVEQMKRLIGVWHDPVMNPMLCLYTQNGNYRPNHNVFGYVRTTNKNKKHQGVDLLAKPNTPLFACFDGKVIRTETQSGYGKIIMIQIDDIETLKTCKIDYNLKYEDKGELSEGDGFNLKGSIYLFYAHLNSFCVEVGELVKSGQVIGKSGTTGYGSSKDPHLHFEIRNKVSSRGLNNRCNPAFFVDYKNENEMSESEKKYQKTIAEKYWD